MSQQPNSKSLSDYETAWSPTSPLEFRLFSSLGNPFGGSSSFLRSIPRMHQKSWDSGKVGLRIVDSLDDHHTDSSRILLPSPDSKNMIFGSLMMNPFAKSPPIHKDDKANGDSSCSGAGNIIDACEQGSSLSEPIENEVEISEDYTCVISHGPNPKTTHIYGSQVLESVEHDEMKKGCCEDKKESIFVISPLDLTTIADDELPPNDFLSFCSFCSKKLGMGKDIYMYRGYKAFCSSECRSEVILLDEEREQEDDEEEANTDSSSGKDLSKKKSNGVIFTVG